MSSVCFAGLQSDTNLGDLVIFASTEGLYKRALSENNNISFNRLDLLYKNKSIVIKGVRKIVRILDRFSLLDGQRFEINLLKKHYKAQIHNIGLFVVVGGGLIKYKYQNFHLMLTALIEVAEELNVPLVINAAGVEGYSAEDARCQLLKNSLNKNIVKSITTRDDIETLNQGYLRNNQTHRAKVADPAVYSDEMYQQKKKTSNVYGIGLVRGGIFLDNERDFKPTEIAHFYAELILEMEKRNLNYQLFTNGFSADSELVELIEKNIGGKNLNVIEPQKDGDLIKTISAFKGVVAARLHANIISYALNIPSIGLVWNDKLALFGKDIGYPERFFEHHELNAEKVVDALVLATEQGYEPQNWLEYKETAKFNIEKIVNKWLLGNL